MTLGLTALMLIATVVAPMNVFAAEGANIQSKNKVSFTIKNTNDLAILSDAFRHCLWNALMKQSIGVSAAEEWATAHEYDSYGTDKDMDLYNNKIGRSIYVSGQSTAYIVNGVNIKVKYGYCRRVPGRHLTYTSGDGMQ